MGGGWGARKRGGGWMSGSDIDESSHEGVLGGGEM